MKPEHSDDFALRASDPELWLDTSRQLLTAAQSANLAFSDTLGSFDDAARTAQVGHMKAIMLLVGLAVENALKALAVSRNVLAVTASTLALPGPFGSHNIAGMATALDEFGDDASRDLLRRLTLAVQWGARYPVPKAGVRMPTDGVSLRYSPDDLIGAAALVDRVQFLIRAV